MANNELGLNYAKNISEPLLRSLLQSFSEDQIPGIRHAWLASDYQDRCEHIDVIATVAAPDNIANIELYFDNKDKENFNTPNYTIDDSLLAYIESCKEHNKHWYEHHHLTFHLAENKKLIDKFLCVSTKEFYECYVNGSLPSTHNGTYRLFNVNDLAALKSAKILKKRHLTV